MEEGGQQQERYLARKDTGRCITYHSGMEYEWMTDALFWRKVDRSAGPEGCWPWTGYIEPSGYGRLGRTINGCHRRLLVHRYAWAQHNGVWLPSGDLQVRHRCDNPPCCNPITCLLLGTAVDNMQDCLARGRRRGGRRNGEVHPRSKLTDVQVAQMRADRYERGLSVAVLAEHYNISKAQVSKVTRGVSRSATTDPDTVVLSAAAISDIRARRARGETLAMISVAHHVPVVQVSHVVHRRGYR